MAFLCGRWCLCRQKKVRESVPLAKRARQNSTFQGPWIWKREGTICTNEGQLETNLCIFGQLSRTWDLDLDWDWDGPIGQSKALPSSFHLFSSRWASILMVFIESWQDWQWTNVMLVCLRSTRTQGPSPCLTWWRSASPPNVSQQKAGCRWTLSNWLTATLLTTTGR